MLLRGEELQTCEVNILLPWNSSGGLTDIFPTESLQAFGTWRKVVEKTFLLYYSGIATGVTVFKDQKVTEGVKLWRSKETF